MSNKLRLTSNAMMKGLVTFLFIGIIIFEVSVFKSIHYYGTMVLILIVTAMSYGGVIRVHLLKYHYALIALMCYSAISSVWAMSKSDAFSISRGLFLIVLFTAIISSFYNKAIDIDDLLFAMKWSGYIIAMYSIMFYGLGYLISASMLSGIRLDNEYANINSIAMMAAYGFSIGLYDLIIYKKKDISALLMIPCILVVAATQSRKAVIIVGVFFVGTMIVAALRDRNFGKILLRIVLAVIILGVAFHYVSTLPIFSGVSERINDALIGLLGKRAASSYIPVRERMISLGMEIWREHPILGIGMGNAHLIADSALNFNAYLHCNYVELLADGGLIAFIIYYSMHIYLLLKLIKYRKCDYIHFAVGMMLILSTLLSDYGQVSYYTKPECFYMVIQFINVVFL